MAGAVPLRAPNAGGGLPPAGALVPEPVPVALADMVGTVIVGFWGLIVVLAMVCCRITGTAGCVVRGSDPCHVSSRKWLSNALTQHDDEDYL
jgi:hypothetical protein